MTESGYLLNYEDQQKLVRENAALKTRLAAVEADADRLAVTLEKIINGGDTQEALNALAQHEQSKGE